MGIKITRKLLDDYRRLKREIPLLELELVEMLQGDNGFDNSTIFDWELRERREKVLDGKKDKVKAVEKWIEAIEDGQTRCVFRMFYQDGMTWDRIAAKTGYSKSPDYPRLMIRDKYLKEMDIT